MSQDSARGFPLKRRLLLEAPGSFFGALIELLRPRSDGGSYLAGRRFIELEHLSLL
jgi:hypothetical protein